jgi:hypothetical protein
LDITYKTPSKFKGSVLASLLGVEAHLENKIGNRFTYLVGARYRANGYLLNSLPTKGSYNPVFMDAQLKQALDFANYRQTFSIQKRTLKEKIEAKLTYGYNYLTDAYFKVESSQALPSGHHIFSMEFEPTGPADIAKGKGTPAKITLLVDGHAVGEGNLPVTIPLNLGLAAGIAIGADPGSPTMPDYQPPFKFTGEVKKALIDVTGEAVEDKEAKMRMYLARQ